MSLWRHTLSAITLCVWRLFITASNAIFRFPDWTIVTALYIPLLEDWLPLQRLSAHPLSVFQFYMNTEVFSLSPTPNPNQNPLYYWYFFQVSYITELSGSSFGAKKEDYWWLRLFCFSMFTRCRRGRKCRIHEDDLYVIFLFYLHALTRALQCNWVLLTVQTYILHFLENLPNVVYISCSFVV